MRRRAASCRLAAAMIIALAGAAAAQAPAGARTQDDPFHVFLVVWRGETDVEHGLRAHMRERGIPVRYTLRNLEQDRSRISGIVAEIRTAQPDLVHTFGTSTTLGILGARDAADPAAHVQGIPGVFSIVAYPIEANIVESFESTGRPVTGTAFLPPVSKQLDALLQYRSVERLGVVYNSLERNSLINIEELREEAAERGIELLEAPVPLDADGRADAGRLTEVVGGLADDGAEFLYMGPDSFVTRNDVRITEAAVARGVPVFAGTEASFAGSQAMLGFVSPYYLVGKLAGAQAERILVGGERPEDIPVKPLARFSLVIRMSVALDLGIYPPLGLLRVAQVVE